MTRTSITNLENSAKSQLQKHIITIDKRLNAASTQFGSEIEAILFQAKSTALLALVQLEDQ